MNRYEFPVVLSGFGETPEEAWKNAVENFEGNYMPDNFSSFEEEGDN